jgi:RimJ/RimL family protein N-acetyltransferase
MTPQVNEYGQPVGPPLPDWVPPPAPSRATTVGRYVRLEPLAVRHADILFDTYAAAPDGRSWTYLFDGPYTEKAKYREWVASIESSTDPVMFALLDPTGAPLGMAGYLRIAPAVGSIEVGHIHYAPAAKRTPAATEAMYLMMKWAFEAGYRRYEWKCDSLNAGSRAAAQRLGFSYEGLFRQAIVYKGRSRDTTWFAMIDSEWPALKAAFGAWLDPANFDANGRQKTRLSDRTGPILKARG